MSIFLSPRLQPLRSSSRDSCLSFVPQSLTTAEIAQLIIIFVFRQLLSLVGLGNDGISTSRNGGLADLLELHLSMPFHVNEDTLRDYAKAVSLDDSSSIWNDEAQTCLLLSALGEPAMLLLLASRDCPILPLGAVNVRNRFEILLPQRCTEEALLNMKEAELRARILPEMRRARRGVEIDLEVTIVNLSEDVAIFRQVFTMLQFVKFKIPEATPKGDVFKQGVDTDWHRQPHTLFHMERNAPLTWARICMDYNVLHTSTLAAKLFGFSGRIAHGNHALALGLARLGTESDRSSLSPVQKWEPVAMNVQFVKPMTLPATLSAQMRVNREHHDLRISRGDKVCVTASLKALSDS